MAGTRPFQAGDDLGGLTVEQAAALRSLCGRYNVEFRPSDYRPVGRPAGWVEGWVGGPDAGKIYVGCDPEGRIHS
jgi:hypothetical protein